MQAAFGTVLWIVCIAGVLIALLCLVFSQKTWEEFGRGGLVMDRDPSGAGSAPTSTHERDDEIRQMLEARNRRRLRRGEEPVDIEQELRRMTAPAIDQELRQEIRQLVIARNNRRARRGQPPLDVESEIERQIADLGSL